MLLPASYADGYHIDNNSRRTSFDFKLVNNLILVPVTINDTLDLQFLLDTGVRSTLLIDEVGLFTRHEDARPVQIAGVGEQRHINAFVMDGLKISLPGITGTNQTMVVLQEDFLKLSTHLGVEVHGIIGYDFFNSFVVQINYSRHRIVVFNQGRFKQKRRHIDLPINVEFGRPYLSAKIIQDDLEEIDAKLLIDSGASHGILLEVDSDARLKLPDSVIQTIIGWGLGGELSGFLGRIKSIEIGTFEFEDILASFTEGYSDPRLFESLGRRGSIGGEILSRFTTTYDFANELIYLRKNTKFNRKFEFNLSGIDLVAEGKNYKTFRVLNVIDGSPASEADVLQGDIILRANGQYAAQLSLGDLNSMMRLRPGRRIDLVIYREGEILNFRFRLRRLI